MPLSNKETAKNYKRRVFEEMQYSGIPLKFIGCMVKFFWFYRNKRCEWFSGVKKKNLFAVFCLNKIAARLPFRKNFKFGLNQPFRNP